MINISLETHPDLYKDYRKGLDFLSKINCEDFEYPVDITYFHVYSEVRTDKELECIKSFLATQNLEKTKLIVWSDYCIENNKLIAPYKHLIELRVYDAKHESKDTPLENHPVWILGDISDSKHYMKSGILRFLVTYKYGGVWADMDMIFLRDFKPILDQEWAYMWGSETDFSNFGACAAMMNLKRKSDHANRCLQEICNTSLVKDSTILDHMLLAKVYKKEPFAVFPSTFFNTEWLMSQTDLPFRKFMQNGFEKIETDRDFLFLDAFAWHWHNSSNKNRNIEDGSKFDLLRKRTDLLLENKFKIL